MLINNNINNLSGGVTQQPVANRFDTQVEIMENFQIEVAKGLVRRNPLEYINTLSGIEYSNNMISHYWDRADDLNKFGILVSKNAIGVFNDLGNLVSWDIGSEHQAIIDSWRNLDNDYDWKHGLKFITIGDTTWILNTNIEVLSTNEAVVAESHKAFFWIKRSFDDGQGGGYSYEVVLAGIKYISTNIDSSKAISNVSTLPEELGLAQAITGNNSAPINGILMGNGYTIKVSGSIMRISNSIAFTFEYGDSWGNQATKGWTNSVTKMSDLPADLRGFTISDVGTLAVTGAGKDMDNAYFIKWENEIWKETYTDKEESSNFTGKVSLTKETLPVKLVLTANGEFKMSWIADWEDRLVGNETTNPLPSFVGNKISNIFFYKNRLGFSTEDSVVMSKVGNYYKFFASTVIEVLDDDVIDVSVDSNTVCNIKNVNIVSGSVTLWSNEAQFLLSGGDVLSPSTTRVSQTSSYSSDSSIAPIVLDNEIMFFSKKENYLEVLVYSPASVNTDSSSAESISSHIPSYIGSTVKTVCASSKHNMLFILTSTEPKNIIVYKYYLSGGKKVISSWYKWTFGEDIKEINVLGDVLFVMTRINTLSKIDLAFDDSKIFRDNDTSIGTGTAYASKVRLSPFNVETAQGTKVIRTPFYMKNIKIDYKGSLNLDIINSERNRTTTVLNKFLKRRLFIGGNSDKIQLEFNTNNIDTFGELNTISVEGMMNPQSKNI